jgi:putative flippase GtrA
LVGRGEQLLSLKITSVKHHKEYPYWGPLSLVGVVQPLSSSSGSAQGKRTYRQKLLQIDKRYGVFRAAKFGIAGAVGFLVAEAIIIIGLYVIYGRANIPSTIYSSPVLLVLNIVAFVIGVTVGFFINEQITVKNVGDQRQKGVKNTSIRLLKFQAVYAIGNAITIGVQLGLLDAFSLSPAIGNIIGAIVAFPVSYFFSMRIVWKLVAINRESESGEKLASNNNTKIKKSVKPEV